nr:uncharacterized protein LOC127315661 [Lolium perenne]
MKECPHNTSVRGAPPPKKFTKPPVAGHGRLTHVTAEEAEADPSVIMGKLPKSRGVFRKSPFFFLSPTGSSSVELPWPPDGAGRRDCFRRPLAAYKTSPPPEKTLARPSSSPSSSRAARPNLARPTSPSPPLRASPRQADAARRSAATPSTSSAQQRRPTGPESAESGPARAAGPRRSPVFPASPAPATPPKLHGELGFLPVPSASSISPLERRRVASPHPAAALLNAGVAPATIGGRRHRQTVARIELRRMTPSARSIAARAGRLLLDLRAQGRADVSMMSA